MPSIPAVAPATPQIRDIATIKTVERHVQLTGAGRVAEAKAIAKAPFHNFPLGALGAGAQIVNHVIGERSSLGAWTDGTVLGTAQSFDEAVASAAKIAPKAQDPDHGNVGVFQAKDGFQLLEVGTGGKWGFPVQAKDVQDSNMYTDPNQSKPYPIRVTTTYKWKKLDSSLDAIVGHAYDGSLNVVDFRGTKVGRSATAAPLQA